MLVSNFKGTVSAHLPSLQYSLLAGKKKRFERIKNGRGWNRCKGNDAGTKKNKQQRQRGEGNEKMHKRRKEKVKNILLKDKTKEERKGKKYKEEN